jgi:hypothetical protein
MIPPSSWGPFKVEFSGNQKELVRRLIGKAHVAGYSLQFASELKAIRKKLEHSPRDWGDPLFPLHALQMIVYRGIHERIPVTNGVHDRLPIVFIRDFEPILDHPLAATD